MIATPVAMEIPLRTDEYGVIRVGNTRVTLATVIACHKLGDSPEAIHEGFPTVPLADIFAIIAYYLANKDEVDSYLSEVNAEADIRQQKYEAEHPEAREFNDKVRALLEEKRGL